MDKQRTVRVQMVERPKEPPRIVRFERVGVSPEPEGEPLLTVKEVAARLRVHPETVKGWLRSGQLHGYLIARKSGWRVRASEVEAFLERRTLETAGKDAA